MSRFQIFPDAEATARAAAERFVAAAERAISARGRFSVALSGGNTPLPTYRLLANEFAEQVAWSKTQVFWVDERCVPPAHEASNYGAARRELLVHLPIPPDNIYRMEGELPPKFAAESYIRTLDAYFGHKRRLDLVLLGMGTDAHTASLFPGDDALRSIMPVTVVPREDGITRLTLTAATINEAREICFLVSGAEKADILWEVHHSAPDPLKYPAQLIHPVDGQLVWLLDEAAANYVDA
ncbi:MAG: 6-phosphogluconolactonase [Anaerolineaceae bacterium]|nr:6-phosphogluconolactonase [Anaerolineaceae bacterium]MCY4107129.1 6-phosphogluconolactonase [Chloroflexota bacterium]